MQDYRILRKYNDGTYFTYSHGNFDDYHLMFHTADGRPHDLLDKDYLKRIKTIANVYGTEKVYSNFMIIVKCIEKISTLNPQNVQPIKQDLEKIANFSKDFGESRLSINKLYDCFYFAMISEWHWHNSKLHHRLKHLAVYQVLFLALPPDEAANWAKHKPYFKIDEEMQKYGI